MGLFLIMVMLFFHAAFVLGLGYFVLYYASKLDNWLKTTGFVIGWLLISVSSLLFIGFSFASLNADFDELHKSKAIIETFKEYHTQDRPDFENGKHLRKGCRIDDLNNDKEG